MAADETMDELPPNSFQNRAPIVIGVVVMCVVISTIMVGARIWTRRMIIRQVGIDDYLSIITLLFVYADGITVAAMTKFGLGKHIWILTDANIFLYMRAFYVSIVLYTVSLLFVKLTFLVQYYRVFSTEKMRKIYLAAIIVVTGWGISQVFVTTFICSPIRGFWDRSVAAKCIPNQTQWYSNAAGNIITDIAVFVLPLPVIKSLDLPRAQKLVLFGIFSLGFFTVAISVIRIRFLRQFEDFTWENVESSCWSIAELTCALTCACLPTLRPLLSLFFPSLATRLTGHSSYVPYGNSSFGVRRKDVEAGFSRSERRKGTITSDDNQEGLSGLSSPLRVTYEMETLAVKGGNQNEDDGVEPMSTGDEITSEPTSKVEEFSQGTTGAAVETKGLPALPKPTILSRLERINAIGEVRIQRALHQTKSSR